MKVPAYILLFYTEYLRQNNLMFFLESMYDPCRVTVYLDGIRDILGITSSQHDRDRNMPGQRMFAYQFISPA